MKNKNEQNDLKLQKDMAYQQLQCVDWLTVIAKLTGIDISSKPIRDIEKKYFHTLSNEVDYLDVSNQLIATQKSILQKIPNEEGLCAINPTCLHREEIFYLDDGVYKAVVDGYKVAKLEKIDEDCDSLVYTSSYISNEKIKINFKDDGAIDNIEIKDIGKINKDFDKISFLTKGYLSKSYKNAKVKHVSSESYIADKNAVIREDVYNYKLNSIVQQIILKKDSYDIEVKTRILLKDTHSKVEISFDSTDDFISVAENWPGYENLYIGKGDNVEFSIFSIKSKIKDNKVILDAEGKGKFDVDFNIHINEVEWQDSSIAEIYQARSMPLIISNMTPKIRPIIELDNYGVLVTKLRLSSNGKYVLVTLKEMYNQDCDCTIKAGFRAKGVFEIDKDHAMIAVTNSKIKFKPHQEYNIAFEL